MGKFNHYYNEVSLKPSKDQIVRQYNRVKKMAGEAEERMDELYTKIENMSDSENTQFLRVYEQFNEMLVQFQDMIITVQQLYSKGELEDEVEVDDDDDDPDDDPDDM